MKLRTEDLVKNTAFCELKTWDKGLLWSACCVANPRQFWTWPSTSIRARFEIRKLAAFMHCPIKRLPVHLAKLESAGLVERVGDGEYAMSREITG